MSVVKLHVDAVLVCGQLAIVMCVMEAGPDLLLAGTLFRKKCGGPYYMNPPRLPSPDTHSSHHRRFVEDPCIPQFIYFFIAFQ